VAVSLGFFSSCSADIPIPGLQYSDIAGLERSIDAAYRIASQRLFDVFFEKFRLLDHLRALKNYLLLGHGDFADQLMEALGYVKRLHLNYQFSYMLFLSAPIYRGRLMHCIATA